MLTPYELLKRIQNVTMKKVGKDVDYNVENLNGIVTIAFNGSNSFKDYWNDFLFFKRKYKVHDKTYKVHHGFLKCWKSAKDYVKADIQAAESKDTVKGYQITGHSMGSALALLCYLEFYRDFKVDNCDVTVFACPRVFGRKNHKALKQIFNGARLFRNGTDLVTHVPFCFWGFRHVAKIIHIGDRNNFLGLFKVAKEHDTPYYKKTFERIIH